MIKINGVKVDVSEIKLSDYLADNGYIISRIVIELNGDILPRESYDTTILKENDKVEILTFVGGG